MQLNCSQKSIEGKLQAGNTLLMNASARGLAGVIIPMAKAFGVRRVVITVSYGTNDFSHYKTQKDLRDQVAKHLLQITKTYAGKRVFIITPKWRGQRDGNYQWGADNGWACLQLIACKGLLACGRLADAKRIARKYIALVERCCEQTGHLWEKYNVRNGSHGAVDEYGTPQMLGWSAGVYQALCAIFETL